MAQRHMQAAAIEGTTAFAFKINSNGMWSVKHEMSTKDVLVEFLYQVSLPGLLFKFGYNFSQLWLECTMQMPLGAHCPQKYMKG